MSLHFADIILPLPLNATFTYRIPDEMLDKVKVGHRVIVPFGKKKFYTGIIVSVHDIEPKGYEVKEISMSLDDSAIVRHPQLKFWQWVADYYLCAIGDVYKAALPAGLKIESETMIEASDDFDLASDDATLSEREAIVYTTLRHSGKLSPKDIEKQTGLRNIESIASTLLSKGAIVVSEKLNERYRVRKEAYVRLLLDTDNRTEAQREAFNKVSRSQKQQTLLLALIEMTGFNHADAPLHDVSRAALIERAGCTTLNCNDLAKKGIIEIYYKEISRFKYTGPINGVLPKLSAEQEIAYRQIHESFLNHSVTLLHGVTASGKTEIYIHLIDYVLNQGRQALFLVPEIALTTQLTRRLQKVFGDKVIIYHSKFSDNERVDIWKRMLDDSTGPTVVIGARSAVFLPFHNLGLVVVDEEHESSYKQYDPAPRYNARDAAIVLATMNGAKTLLGSATPTIETFYKTTIGKYGLVSLNKRFEGTKLPEIDIVDMSLSQKKNSVTGSFSADTISYVRQSLSKNQQAIIFQNRRGYAPIARCKQCQFIPKCDNCDVSLTYHRFSNTLVCHYCGAIYPMPKVCPVCHEPAIEVVGYGTERIEDDIAELFPDAKVLRMDLDTTRSKDSYSAIIDSFSDRKADILVGTQMVTKGLDFAGVSTVVIVNADTLIYYPDFRSNERAFNMIEQVSGRAGRRDGEGKVIIQTYHPEHPILSFVKSHDYQSYYDAELEDRRLFNYPPFTRIINIYLKHRDEHVLEDIAIKYGNRLRELFGTRVFGPEQPQIARIQSLYIRKIMLKVEISASMKRVKEILAATYAELHERADMRGFLIYYDVDPQ